MRQNGMAAVLAAAFFVVSSLTCGSAAAETGLGGTPSGSFRPQILSRNHRSTIFGNAPMPFAIFYSGHYAIHGTTAVSQLGSRASKGCVRLHPSNAATLFALVQRHGMANTRILIQDSARVAQR
jgi:lipoprotein-anchoring transpeptidase ErfK/SrfK